MKHILLALAIVGCMAGAALAAKNLTYIDQQPSELNFQLDGSGPKEFRFFTNSTDTYIFLSGNSTHWMQCDSNATLTGFSCTPVAK